MNKKLLKRIKAMVLCAVFMLNMMSFVTVYGNTDVLSAITYETITNGQSRLAVTDDLTLGGEGITWTSSNEAVIGTDGTVKRPEISDETVLLTASLDNETAEFSVTVLSKLSTVVASTEFESADVLSDYTVNDQGVTVPVEYADGSIQGLYSTVTVENGAMKIVPKDNKMSTINRKDVTDALTGTVVIEKRIDVTDGFDYEIKNPQGKRVIKLQASGGKLYSYSNFNTKDVDISYALPSDYFDMKIVADTSARKFTLYINDEIPSPDFENKDFMAESSGASDICGDKIYFGGYLRTSDKPVYIECESVKTVSDTPEIGEIKALLTENLILGENMALNSVETDLVLKNSYNGLYGAEISWSVSPDTDALKADGTVKRSSEEDVTVTLTATISFNGAEDYKNFTVTVKQKEVDPYLTSAADALDYSVILADGISPFVIIDNNDITLVSGLDGFSDVAIEWESSDENVISADGEVARAELSDRNVKLTAVLTYGDETVKKSFDFTVLSQKNERIYSENFNSEDSLTNYTLTESGNVFSFDSDANAVSGNNASITFENGNAVLTPTDLNQPSFMARNSDCDSLTGIVIIQKRVKITKGFDLEIKNSLGKRVIKLQAPGNKLSSYSNFNTVDKSIDYTLPTDYFDLKIVADTTRKVFTLYINGEIPDEKFENHSFMAECLDAVNIQPSAVFIGSYPRTSQYSILTDFESLSTAVSVMTEDEILSKLKDALILGENTSLDRVTKNLDLKEAYDEIPDAEISWSADSSAVTSDGTVIRDAVTDKEATLTAEISYDGYTYTKTFDVVVLSEKSQIEIALGEISADIIASEEETAEAIVSDLNLEKIEELFDNAEISWESSNEKVITNDGKVIRPNLVDAEVTMTATIIINGVTYNKELNFTVKCHSSVYVGTNGGNIAISNVSETKQANDLTLTLTAKTQSGTENMCLVVYTYDRETGIIKGVDFDEKAVGTDGADFEVSLSSFNQNGDICKYFIWDSFTNHKPLCDLSPSLPENISAEATARDTVTLAWGEAHDDFSAIDKYVIYADGIYEGETSGESYAVGKLDKGQSAVFEVAAVDRNGFESPKTQISAATEKMPVSVADGDNIILPSDASVRFYVETRLGYYGYTEAGKDINGVGYRITTDRIRPNTTTQIISRIPLTLSDNFINENAGNKDFAIEITYFDEGTETMRIIYDDTTSELHGSKSIVMTNTKQWKTTTVIVNDANFKKSSNSGNSYANIMVYTPSAGLKVHAFGIMPLAEFTKDALGFRVEDNMLVLRDAAVKTNAQVQTIDGEAAINAGTNPIEFASLDINASEVEIEVYYYDNFAGNIVLNYCGEGSVTNTVSKATKGTGMWKKVKFTITDAAFDGGLFGEFMANADFSVESTSDKPFCVRTVRVITE